MIIELTTQQNELVSIPIDRILVIEEYKRYDNSTLPSKLILNGSFIQTINGGLSFICRESRAEVHKRIMEAYAQCANLTKLLQDRKTVYDYTHGR